MSEALPSLEVVKNELNEIVSLRKETISKIATHEKSIQDVETELNQLKNSANPNQEQIENLQIQIEQLKTIIQMLKLNNQHHVYDMDALMTNDMNTTFQKLNDSFSKITSNDIHSNGQAVTISLETLDYIKCNFKALQIITTSKNKLMIFPTIALVQDSENSFYIVPTNSLYLERKQENNSSAAATETSSPNEIKFIIPTMYDEVFSFKEKEIADNFYAAFTSYITVLSALSSEPIVGIKRDYFESVNTFSEAFIQFINRLTNDTQFLSHIEKDKSIATLKAESKTIETLGLVDLLKCVYQISDIQNTTSNESFSVIFLQCKLNGIKIERYEDVTKLNSKDILQYYKDLVSSVNDELSESPQQGDSYFNLSSLLISYDKNLHQDYIRIMYQYANLLMKADGRITKHEELRLRQLIQLADHKGASELENSIHEEEKKQTLEQLLYELYDLTGLQTVKQEINTIINLIKIKKAREQFDLKNTDMSLHLVFSGNPGTGKTTVARQLAKIYQCLGVLKKGHLVETDRSGMIAEYVGQTAIKVNKLVDSALDGVLFIDEAYALFADDKDTFGKEAIATLLKRMEDDRDRLIVILAGYTHEMDSFINSNPGLKSRFNKYILFPDYTPDELYSIFIGMSRKLHFVLEPKLGDKIKLRFLEEIEKGDPSFGNGRFVRNLFEKMIENQANRLAQDSELTKEKLSLLCEVDLPQ